MPSCAVRSTSWRRSSNPRHTQRPFHNNTESGESRTTLSAPFFYPDGIPEFPAHTRSATEDFPPRLLSLNPLCSQRSISTSPQNSIRISHYFNQTGSRFVLVPALPRSADLMLLHLTDPLCHSALCYPALLTTLLLRLADHMRPTPPIPINSCDPCRPNPQGKKPKRTRQPAPSFAAESTVAHKQTQKNQDEARLNPILIFRSRYAR